MYDTPIPFISPHSAPSPTPTKITRAIGIFFSATATDAAIVPDNAITDPTERSIPPVIKTNVIPTPITPVIDACFIIFRRFCPLKKLGLITDKIRIRIIITQSIAVFFTNSITEFLLKTFILFPPFCIPMQES